VQPSIELSRAECLQLLEQKSVGRVAFQAADGLRIFPVNYVVHDERIVFRTLPYGVIARSIRLSDVAFEVDDLDEELRSGWSVLAVGRCERLEDPSELAGIRQSGLPQPWADGTRELYFAIRWKGLSGRRLGQL
jgi:uncharacterized protein